MHRIHIIHENDVWTDPLIAELEALELPYERWFLDQGTLDLSEVPPEGVFYNRMSASSHTRGHRYGPEYTSSVLTWLERHGRRVLNGWRANQLEISKVAQYMALDLIGIRYPKTMAIVGERELLDAAQRFDGPFITKHNRAGKGLGVKLFRTVDAFEEALEAGEVEPSIDGTMLLQQYIQAPEPFITRVEFVGQRFMYAVRVDTSEGFELCPADTCQVGSAFCPAGEDVASKPKFEIIEGFEHPLLDKYAHFMRTNDAHVSAFEFIVDQDGRAFTYDVNMNTNYNRAAERIAGHSGMGSLAAYLRRELCRVEAGNLVRRAS